MGGLFSHITNYAQNALWGNIGKWTLNVTLIGSLVQYRTI